MEVINVFENLSTDSRCILEIIQKRGQITKKELCDITNNNITTLNRLFQPLEDLELVMECGLGHSDGGRRPILYSINENHHYVGAVNISSTYYEVAIINFKLEIMTISKVALSEKDIPDDVIQSIYKIYQEQCASLGIDNIKKKIHGLGVSVYSSFDQNSGKLGRPISQYLNEKWSHYHLKEELEKYFELPLVIQNSTASAGMLEYNHGAGKTSGKLLYVLCAMNIRSTVICQDKLLSDHMYYEDAFGHSTIDFSGKKCVCGSYGCVNNYATIPTIIKHVTTSMKSGRETIHKLDEEITIKKICQAAEEGDTLSAEAIKNAATMLGVGLDNYINMMRPEVVILSGLLPNLSDLYYETCINVVKNRTARFMNFDKIEFVKNGYFLESLVVSAGSMMIQRLLIEEA